MSNTLVLRTVYAVNSNTNQFLSTGMTLLTDGVGGTTWMNVISSLTVYGGSVVGYLPSTLHYNNLTMSSLSTDMYYAISSLSTAISETAGTISQAELVSSMAGIGNLDYISSASLTSTVIGLGSAGYVSTASAVQTGLTSTVEGLGSYYISTPSLTSTVEGLGSFYISSASGIVQDGLTSTVIGLGSAGYISSSTEVQDSLTSTVKGLGNFYVSSLSLVSSVKGLGSSGYVSSLSLRSTVQGLASLGYISSSQLVSSVSGMYKAISEKTNVTFDNTTTVIVNDSINTFTNIENLVYISTFLTSSVYYSGNNAESFYGTPLNVHDMIFSTLSLDFSMFSSFVNLNSYVTLDIYPTIAFSKLGTGATNTTILPISSFLQFGSAQLLSTSVTSHVYVGNTVTRLENGTTVDSSNVYNGPIKMSLPPGTISSFNSNYNLVHYMRSSINNGQYQNALHNSLLTPYFGSTGSVFVSIQNIK